MPAGTYDTTVEQGATFKRKLTVIQSTEVVDGAVVKTPADLTGYTARMQIRKRPNSVDVIHSMTDDAASGITFAPSGVIYLEIPDEITEGFTFKQAVYDLEIVSSSGEVTRLLQGELCLSLEVTK